MSLYAAPKGKRYHAAPYCEGLNSYAYWNGHDAPRVTFSEARRRNLQPCKTCQPPPLLAVVSPG